MEFSKVFKLEVLAIYQHLREFRSNDILQVHNPNQTKHLILHNAKQKPEHYAGMKSFTTMENWLKQNKNDIL